MAQVRRAQSSTVRRAAFGETAVQMGFVADADVRRTLGEQEAVRNKGAQPHAIGQLLQAKGHLTPEQVVTVLRGMSNSQLPLSREGVHIAAQLRSRHLQASNVIGIAGAIEYDVATTAAELAITLSCMEHGRVVAVDANLHEPQLHKLLGTPASPGFAEAVQAGQAHPTPMDTRFGTLTLLPAGRSNGDSVVAMMSPAAAHVIDRYRNHCRYVILSLGDILTRPEAAVGASRCDGVVLVVRAEQSHKHEVAEVQRRLHGLNVGLSGVILTRPVRRSRPWFWIGGPR